MKNAINWFELPSVDFDRAVKFYSAVLGVDLHVMDYQGMTLAFFPCDMNEGVGGHIQPGTEASKPTADGATVYLNTNGDIDGCLSRVAPAGGTVVVPKMDIGDAGYIAICIDTEGNRFGLHAGK